MRGRNCGRCSRTSRTTPIRRTGRRRSSSKRAVISTKKLFKLAVKDKEDKEAELFRPIAEDILKRALHESNFADAYSEMMIGSFLLGLGAVKVLWDGGLRYSNVDVFNLFIDPTYQPHDGGSPKYAIEYKETDLATLRQTAKEVNARKHDIESQMRARRGLSEHTQPDKKTNTLEFWGNIPDEKQTKFVKNQLRVLANDKYMIRSQNNPFEHGMAPYILTVPIVYPHRGAAGVSMVEPMVKMQYAYNNITNMSIDNLNFSVNKVFECQPTNLLNAKNLTKIYPGKIINKHTSAEAIREVRTSNIGQDVFTMFDFLGREMEKGSAVTEFIMGTSGKSKTATEAELKTSQAQGLFDVIARDIEANSLRPLIEMSFDLLIQFGELPPEARGKYDFKVGGLSLLLAQERQTNRIGEVMGLALKSEEILQRTDIDELYKKLLDTYNLSDVYTEKPQAPSRDQT
ncbi:MAG: portal protein, partial [Planctomycetota bacterium]